MKLFCTICNNLLVVNTSADDFYFKCNKCYQIYKPDESDTLHYEDIKGTNLIIYKTILQNAGKDPVNPKIYKDCTCGNNIVRQVRLGDALQLINICIKCDKKWLEST